MSHLNPPDPSQAEWSSNVAALLRQSRASLSGGPFESQSQLDHFSQLLQQQQLQSPSQQQIMQQLMLHDAASKIRLNQAMSPLMNHMNPWSQMDLTNFARSQLSPDAFDDANESGLVGRSSAGSTPGFYYGLNPDPSSVFSSAGTGSVFAQYNNATSSSAGSGPAFSQPISTSSTIPSLATNSKNSSSSGGGGGTAQQLMSSRGSIANYLSGLNSQHQGPQGQGQSSGMGLSKYGANSDSHHSSPVTSPLNPSGVQMAPARCHSNSSSSAAPTPYSVHSNGPMTPVGVGSNGPMTPVNQIGNPPSNQSSTSHAMSPAMPVKQDSACNSPYSVGVGTPMMNQANQLVSNQPEAHQPSYLRTHSSLSNLGEQPSAKGSPSSPFKMSATPPVGSPYFRAQQKPANSMYQEQFRAQRQSQQYQYHHQHDLQAQPSQQNPFVADDQAEELFSDDEDPFEDINQVKSSLTNDLMVGSNSNPVTPQTPMTPGTGSSQYGFSEHVPQSNRQSQFNAGQSGAYGSPFHHMPYPSRPGHHATSGNTTTPSPATPSSVNPASPYTLGTSTPNHRATFPYGPNSGLFEQSGSTSKPATPSTPASSTSSSRFSLSKSGNSTPQMMLRANSNEEMVFDPKTGMMKPKKKRGRPRKNTLTSLPGSSGPLPPISTLGILSSPGTSLISKQFEDATTHNSEADPYAFPAFGDPPLLSPISAPFSNTPSQLGSSSSLPPLQSHQPFQASPSPSHTHTHTQSHTHPYTSTTPTIPGQIVKRPRGRPRMNDPNRPPPKPKPPTRPMPSLASLIPGFSGQIPMKRGRGRPKSLKTIIKEVEAQGHVIPPEVLNQLLREQAANQNQVATGSNVRPPNPQMEYTPQHQYSNMTPRLTGSLPMSGHSNASMMLPQEAQAHHQTLAPPMSQDSYFTSESGFICDELRTSTNPEQYHTQPAPSQHEMSPLTALANMSQQTVPVQSHPLTQEEQETMIEQFFANNGELDHDLHDDYVSNPMESMLPVLPPSLPPEEPTNAGVDQPPIPPIKINQAMIQQVTPVLPLKRRRIPSESSSDTTGDDESSFSASEMDASDDDDDDDNDDDDDDDDEVVDDIDDSDCSYGGTKKRKQARQGSSGGKRRSSKGSSGSSKKAPANTRMASGRRTRTRRKPQAPDMSGKPRCTASIMQRTRALALQLAKVVAEDATEVDGCIQPSPLVKPADPLPPSPEPLPAKPQPPSVPELGATKNEKLPKLPKLVLKRNPIPSTSRAIVSDELALGSYTIFSSLEQTEFNTRKTPEKLEISKELAPVKLTPEKKLEVSNEPATLEISDNLETLDEILIADTPENLETEDKTVADAPEEMENLEDKTVVTLDSSENEEVLVAEKLETFQDTIIAEKPEKLVTSDVSVVADTPEILEILNEIAPTRKSTRSRSPRKAAPSKVSEKMETRKETAEKSALEKLEILETFKMADTVATTEKIETTKEETASKTPDKEEILQDVTVSVKPEILIIDTSATGIPEEMTTSKVEVSPSIRSKRTRSPKKTILAKTDDVLEVLSSKTSEKAKTITLSPSEDNYKVSSSTRSSSKVLNPTKTSPKAPSPASVSPKAPSPTKTSPKVSISTKASSKIASSSKTISSKDPSPTKVNSKAFSPAKASSKADETPKSECRYSLRRSARLSSSSSSHESPVKESPTKLISPKSTKSPKAKGHSPTVEEPCTSSAQTTSNVETQELSAQPDEISVNLGQQSEIAVEDTNIFKEPSSMNVDDANKGSTEKEKDEESSGDDSPMGDFGTSYLSADSSDTEEEMELDSASKTETFPAISEIAITVQDEPKSKLEKVDSGNIETRKREHPETGSSEVTNITATSNFILSVESEKRQKIEVPKIVEPNDPKEIEAPRKLEPKVSHLLSPHQTKMAKKYNLSSPNLSEDSSDSEDEQTSSLPRASEEPVATTVKMAPEPEKVELNLVQPAEVIPAQSSLQQGGDNASWNDQLNDLNLNLAQEESHESSLMPFDQAELRDDSELFGLVTEPNVDLPRDFVNEDLFDDRLLRTPPPPPVMSGPSMPVNPLRPFTIDGKLISETEQCSAIDSIINLESDVMVQDRAESGTIDFDFDFMPSINDESADQSGDMVSIESSDLVQSSLLHSTGPNESTPFVSSSLQESMAIPLPPEEPDQSKSTQVFPDSKQNDQPVCEDLDLGQNLPEAIPSQLAVTESNVELSTSSEPKTSPVQSSSVSDLPENSKVPLMVPLVNPPSNALSELKPTPIESEARSTLLNPPPVIAAKSKPKPEKEVNLMSDLSNLSSSQSQSGQSASAGDHLPRATRSQPKPVLSDPAPSLLSSPSERISSQADPLLDTCPSSQVTPQAPHTSFELTTLPPPAESVEEHRSVAVADLAESLFSPASHSMGSTTSPFLTITDELPTSPVKPIQPTQVDPGEYITRTPPDPNSFTQLQPVPPDLTEDDLVTTELAAAKFTVPAEANSTDPVSAPSIPNPPATVESKSAESSSASPQVTTVPPVGSLIPQCITPVLPVASKSVEPPKPAPVSSKSKPKCKPKAVAPKPVPVPPPPPPTSTVNANPGLVAGSPMTIQVTASAPQAIAPQPTPIQFSGAMTNNNPLFVSSTPIRIQQPMTIFNQAPRQQAIFVSPSGQIIPAQPTFQLGGQSFMIQQRPNFATNGPINFILPPGQQLGAPATGLQFSRPLIIRQQLPGLGPRFIQIPLQTGQTLRPHFAFPNQFVLHQQQQQLVQPQFITQQPQQQPPPSLESTSTGLEATKPTPTNETKDSKPKKDILTEAMAVLDFDGLDDFDDMDKPSDPISEPPTESVPSMYPQQPIVEPTNKTESFNVTAPQDLQLTNDDFDKLFSDTNYVVPEDYDHSEILAQFDGFGETNQPPTPSPNVDLAEDNSMENESIDDVIEQSKSLQFSLKSAVTKLVSELIEVSTPGDSKKTVTIEQANLSNPSGTVSQLIDQTVASASFFPQTSSSVQPNWNVAFDENEFSQPSLQPQDSYNQFQDLSMLQPAQPLDMNPTPLLPVTQSLLHSQSNSYVPNVENGIQVPTPSELSSTVAELDLNVPNEVSQTPTWRKLQQTESFLMTPPRVVEPEDEDEVPTVMEVESKLDSSVDSVVHSILEDCFDIVEMEASFMWPQVEDEKLDQSDEQEKSLQNIVTVKEEESSEPIIQALDRLLETTVEIESSTSPKEELLIDENHDDSDELQNGLGKAPSLLESEVMSLIDDSEEKKPNDAQELDLSTVQNISEQEVASEIQSEPMEQVNESEESEMSVVQSTVESSILHQPSPKELDNTIEPEPSMLEVSENQSELMENVKENNELEMSTVLSATESSDLPENVPKESENTVEPEPFVSGVSESQSELKESQVEEMSLVESATDSSILSEQVSNESEIKVESEPSVSEVSESQSEFMENQEEEMSLVESATDSSILSEQVSNESEIKVEPEPSVSEVSENLNGLKENQDSEISLFESATDSSILIEPVPKESEIKVEPESSVSEVSERQNESKESQESEMSLFESATDPSILSEQVPEESEIKVEPESSASEVFESQSELDKNEEESKELETPAVSNATESSMLQENAPKESENTVEPESSVSEVSESQNELKESQESEMSLELESATDSSISSEQVPEESEIKIESESSASEVFESQSELKEHEQEESQVLDVQSATESSISPEQTPNESETQVESEPSTSVVSESQNESMDHVQESKESEKHAIQEISESSIQKAPEELGDKIEPEPSTSEKNDNKAKLVRIPSKSLVMYDLSDDDSDADLMSPKHAPLELINNIPEPVSNEEPSESTSPEGKVSSAVITESTDDDDVLDSLTIKQPEMTSPDNRTREVLSLKRSVVDTVSDACNDLVHQLITQVVSSPPIQPEPIERTVSFVSLEHKFLPDQTFYFPNKKKRGGHSLDIFHMANDKSPKRCLRSHSMTACNKDNTIQTIVESEEEEEVGEVRKGRKRHHSDFTMNHDTTLHVSCAKYVPNSTSSCNCNNKKPRTRSQSLVINKRARLSEEEKEDPTSVQHPDISSSVEDKPENQLESPCSQCLSCIHHRNTPSLSITLNTEIVVNAPHSHQNSTTTDHLVIRINNNASSTPGENDPVVVNPSPDNSDQADDHHDEES